MTKKEAFEFGMQVRLALEKNAGRGISEPGAAGAEFLSRIPEAVRDLLELPVAGIVVAGAGAGLLGYGGGALAEKLTSPSTADFRDLKRKQLQQEYVLAVKRLQLQRQQNTVIDGGHKI